MEHMAEKSTQSNHILPMRRIKKAGLMRRSHNGAFLNNNTQSLSMIQSRQSSNRASSVFQ